MAPARNTAGEHLVLNVGWCHDEALHEADGLRIWDGEGAVRLIDVLVVGQTSALLLEACEPGTALSQALPPQEQDAVVASLLSRLWIEPPAGHPFRSLHSMCDRWADEFEEKYAATGAQRHRVDPGLAQAGMQLFRSLPGTAERAVLLCTDLHPDNVLAARRESWLVIDPKPYFGDPTYDPLQHMLNFPDRLTANPTASPSEWPPSSALTPNGYDSGSSPAACRNPSTSRTYKRRHRTRALTSAASTSGSAERL